MKNEHILIFCGFLDLFSVSILLNSLTIQVKSFEISNISLGFFTSLYGALQIISSYLMGYLSDRFGRKPILCMCALFSSLGYALIGQAQSFFWIFAFRFITGLFKQTQTQSRAILASSATKHDMDKVKQLGRFSTLSSMGFIFGPPIGGYIYEQYGFKHVASLTSLGFFTMFGLYTIMITIPKSTKSKLTQDETLSLHLHNERYRPNELGDDQGGSHSRISAQIKANIYDTPLRVGISSKEKQQQISSVAPQSPSHNPYSNSNNIQLDNQSLWRSTWDIQLAIFMLSFCPLLFRTNYSLTLRELFNSTSTWSGVATSYGAITGSLAGLVVPSIIRYYRTKYNRVAREPRYHKTGDDRGQSDGGGTTNAEVQLLWHTSLILSMSVLGCTMAPSFLWFVLCQSPISFVNGVSREALNVVVARRVHPSKVGSVMGLSGSLVAFGRLIAPLLGGFLVDLMSYRLPGAVAAICAFTAALVIRRYF